MKKGFTLAEVLITIAIIGVVAALTIPGIIAKVDKHQHYVRFMKIYNTLQKAFQLSVAENGNPNNWNRGNLNTEDYFKKYLGKYLNISKDCTGDPEGCGAKGKRVYVLGGDLEGDYANYMDDQSYPLSLMLQDGSILMLWSWEFGFTENGYSHFEGMIMIDTNGASKGPNTWGRDLFVFILDNYTPNRTYILRPSEMYRDGPGGPGYDNLGSFAPIPYQEIIDGCAPSSGADFCGARLLLEHKMDY